jgi:hypothetical protein
MSAERSGQRYRWSMSESTDEVPDWANVWLDDDVAAWLHEQADEHFDGDVGRTLNSAVRVVMALVTQPQDPWAAVVTHAQVRPQK